MVETHLRIASAADDAARLAAIYGPYVRDTSISFETEPPTADEMRRRVEEVLERHVWLVACRGGEVVGYAYGSPHRTRAAYRWSVDAAVYLEPSSHRGGIARRLYGALFAILAMQRYVNVYAGITLPNPASVGFHEAMGFAPVGVYRRVGFKQGSWHDVGWWSRALREVPGEPEEPLRLGDLDAAALRESLRRCVR
jgi:phosphinothricin acetyltransferase